MKKVYTQPTIEVLNFTNAPITTANTSTFDPQNILNKDGDKWFD